MPPQNTHEIFRKEIELFREGWDKISDKDSVSEIRKAYIESFLLASLRRASLAVVEAKIKEVEKEKEILEKVLLKATMPGNIAIYEEKIETIDDVLGILNSDTLATARTIVGEDKK